MCSQKLKAKPLGETKNKRIGGGRDLLDLLKGQRDRWKTRKAESGNLAYKKK